MNDKTDRALLFKTNKFQKLIIYPTVIFCIVAAVLVYICLEYNIRISIYSDEPYVLGMDADKLRHAIPMILVGIALMLVCIIAWSYYIANKIAGPHERILKELDEVIEGYRKDELTVRKDDKMFAELLEKINVIIARQK